MEAKEEIYQYIRKNIKEDGVTAQSIAEIFGIKRNVASHYLNLLEKEGKLQKGTNRPVHFSIPTDTEKKAEECNNMIDERSAAQKEVSGKWTDDDHMWCERSRKKLSCIIDSSVCGRIRGSRKKCSFRCIKLCGLCE